MKITVFAERTNGLIFSRWNIKEKLKWKMLAWTSNYVHYECELMCVYHVEICRLVFMLLLFFFRCKMKIQIVRFAFELNDWLLARP